MDTGDDMASMYGPTCTTTNAEPQFKSVAMLIATLLTSLGMTSALISHGMAPRARQCARARVAPTKSYAETGDVHAEKENGGP
jgi:hypothetical protein